MAEREYVTDQIINNKNNINCLWKAIQSCIPKKSASQRNYNKDNKIVADEFNHFFVSMGENIIKKISELANDSNYNLGEHLSVPREHLLSDQFVFSPVEHT